MLFSIIVFLMVVLVAMFWTYQGLLSSTIMFVETLIAFMLAWEFHEALHGVWRESLGDGIGLPSAFILIFLVALILQREITDRLVKKNVTIPIYFDRAGGGIVGLFTGLLLVGAALIPVQMLPIGGDIFGFDRVYENEDGKRQIRKLGFVNPDGFAIWIGEALSTRRFGAGNALAVARPDPLVDWYGARDATQTEDLHFIPPKSIEVTGYWFTDRIDQVKHSMESNKLKRSFDTLSASDTGTRYLVAHVVVKRSAMPKDKGNIWFRAPQFRLFGPAPVEGSAVAPRCYLAVGMTDLYSNKEQELQKVSDAQTGRLVRFNTQTNFIIGEGVTPAIVVKEANESGAETVTGFGFDVAFEVPSDWDENSPWYLEFKRGARFDFSGKKKELYQKEIPDEASIALGKDGSGGAARSSSPVGGGVKGVTNVAHAIEERTGVSKLLPTILDSGNSAVSRVVQGGKLGSGKVVFEVPEQPIDEGSRITEFAVPDDKRLVQIGAEKNFPGSMFGRALNYATNVVAQIFVQDDKGENYYAIGVYSAAVVNGKWVFEIQYKPDAEMPDKPGTLEKPERLTQTVMKNAKPAERKFGYLFLVPPGTHLVKFFTGGRNGQSQEIDITTE